MNCYRVVRPWDSTVWHFVEGSQAICFCIFFQLHQNAKTWGKQLLRLPWWPCGPASPCHTRRRAGSGCPDTTYRLTLTPNNNHLDSLACRHEDILLQRFLGLIQVVSRFHFFDVCLSALNAAYATSTEDNIIYVWRHLRAPLHIMYTANSYKFHVCCFLLPKHVFRNFCTNSQKSTASLRHLSRWVCYCTCCIHAREGRPLTQLLGIVWQSKFVMQSTLITKFWNFFSVSDSSLSMLKKSWFVASWSWLFYTLWCDWCSLALALGYHRKFNLRLEFTNAVWNTVICVLHQNMAELDRTVNCCLANR
jgi:hypothetical protein